MELKRAKVVKLRTKDENAPVWETIYDTGVGPTSDLRFKEAVEVNSPITLNYYHLYFLTDDEIKEGDWCIMLDDLGNIFSNPQQYLGKEKGHTLNSNVRKIIATTNPKIINKQRKFNYNPEFHGMNNGGNYFDREYQYDLPQSSQAFIEKYCELGGIDEVMVEYELDHVGILGEQNGEDVSGDYQPKVNSHNTITIHPVKYSWSKEEVERLCRKAFQAGDTYRLYLDKNIMSIANEGIPDSDTIMSTMGEDNFIQENL